MPNNKYVADEEVTKKNKLITEETQMRKKMLSRFELTLVRCCSSSVDREVGRCFEVNGFGGINFLKTPCEHLENVLEKLKKIRNSKKHTIPTKTERGMPDNEITDEEVTK